MNLAKIFSDKTAFELAVALSGLPSDSPERTTLAARAGLGEATANELLQTVNTLEALRYSTGCVDCDACVDENTLAEFVDGVLDEVELAAVERKLAVCGGCLRNAVTLAQLAHELAPPTPWKEVVLGIARRGLHIVTAPFEGFTELDLQPVASLSAAAVATAARRWRLEDNGIAATFTVTLEEGGMVAMTMGFEKDGEALVGGRVALRANDLLVEVQPIGSTWELHTFWHIEPGQYLVEVTGPDMATAQFPISIEGGDGN